MNGLHGLSMQYAATLYTLLELFSLAVCFEEATVNLLISSFTI